MDSCCEGIEAEAENVNGKTAEIILSDSSISSVTSRLRHSPIHPLVVASLHLNYPVVVLSPLAVVLLVDDQDFHLLQTGLLLDRFTPELKGRNGGMTLCNAGRQSRSPKHDGLFPSQDNSFRCQHRIGSHGTRTRYLNKAMADRPPREESP